ncbi:hypothetical protein D3C80_1411070 [compost metagenome]
MEYRLTSRPRNTTAKTISVLMRSMIKPNSATLPYCSSVMVVSALPWARNSQPMTTVPSVANSANRVHIHLAIRCGTQAVSSAPINGSSSVARAVYCKQSVFSIMGFLAATDRLGKRQRPAPLRQNRAR